MIKLKKKDKLYNKAKAIVTKDKNYSISYLQRQLGIGYNRAGEIIQSLKKDLHS